MSVGILDKDRGRADLRHSRRDVQVERLLPVRKAHTRDLDSKGLLVKVKERISRTGIHRIVGLGHTLFHFDK